MLETPLPAPQSRLLSVTETGLPPRPRHLAFLDGLRALAALWVVLSHLWISQFGMLAHDGWLGLATNWVLYSHLAVDGFIVLSGFCLILPVGRDRGLKGGALGFFTRRARRILPPFYASLAISLVWSLVRQALDHHALSLNGLALLVNILLLQDLFLPLNIFNGPFWSIAVEWRIYFLFPALVWLLRRWGKRAVLAVSAIAALGVTVPLLRWHPEMGMASPWYLFLFALGVCAGSLADGGMDDKKEARKVGRRFWLPVCLLSTLTLAILLHAHPVTKQEGADFGRFMPLVDVAAGMGMASLLLILSRSPQAFPLLSWHPLVALGAFAYSLYLIHLPCLLLFNHLLTAGWPALTDPFQRVLILAMGLPLVIGLAYLFYLAFERPFLSRRAKTAPADK